MVVFLVRGLITGDGGIQVRFFLLLIVGIVDRDRLRELQIGKPESFLPAPPRTVLRRELHAGSNTERTLSKKKIYSVSTN